MPVAPLVTKQGKPMTPLDSGAMTNGQTNETTSGGAEWLRHWAQILPMTRHSFIVICSLLETKSSL